MTNSESQSNASQNTSIYPILTINFVGTLGFSIVLPFLVFLVTQWGGNALIYGIMGATYSFFQLIGAPILGKWSDKIGRRKVLLLSQSGTLLSWVILLSAFFLPVKELAIIDNSLLGQFTLTLPLLILFIARAADGITGGNVSVANAYLADVTPDDKRNENFGKMSISSNLGFIFGPAIAGVLGATAMGEKLPVIVAMVISLIATILIYFRLPESNPSLLKTDHASKQIHKVFGQELKHCYKISGEKEATIREIFEIPNMTLIFSIYFLIMLAFNFFYVAFPVYAVKSLKWQLSDTGIFFTVLSFLMVIVQGPVLTRLSRKWSDSVLMSTGGFVLVFGFYLYATTNVQTIYLSAVLMALGNGLMWPSTMSLLSKLAGHEYQGAVQGYAGSFGAIASIIGLLVGGIMYNSFEGNIFILAAAIIAVTFLMALVLSRKVARANN